MSEALVSRMTYWCRINLLAPDSKLTFPNDPTFVNKSTRPFVRRHATAMVDYHSAPKVWMTDETDTPTLVPVAVMEGFLIRAARLMVR